MPTYEYECQKCGHQFEEYQSIKADPLTDCPTDACNGKVKRLISSGGGLLFKGSGFYITDYRSDSYKQAAKADKSAGSGDKGASDTPAKKAEPKAAAATAD
jgi:putative FmdB family regulatory protein